MGTTEIDPLYVGELVDDDLFDEVPGRLEVVAVNEAEEFVTVRRLIRP